MRFGTSLLLIALLASASSGAKLAITNYTVISKNCRVRASGQIVRATRSFYLDGQRRIFTFDIETLNPSLFRPVQLNCADSAATAAFKLSKFASLLNASGAAPFPIHNDGIQHGLSPIPGTFLTVDLCPASHERFEHRLFDELEKSATIAGSSIPVAIAVSGKWMERHPDDFSSLRHLSATGKLAITWVNHTDSHPYQAEAPMDRNFLLTPGIDREREMTGAERELLAAGELPSPFFRFPGLVSDREWIQRITARSLIALGSDAWIATGQSPTNGSVVLVHGNGNEPEGVRKFLKILPEIEARGPFLPLSALF